MHAMHSEPRLLPSQYGQLHEALLYSPYNYEIPVYFPYDLIRLHREKDCLSMQLADCVTYLKALREKQVKNALQLNIESTLPQKKRKRLQQTKRHLEGEIRNRERDEKAFLNNLQACETNIILANMKAFYLANASFHASAPTSTPTLYTPTLCSQSRLEGTDLTWDGWTDNAAVSPFQKRGSTPFAVDDLAPEVYTEGLGCDFDIAKDVKRPRPLSRDALELSNSHPLTPNTAQSHFGRSTILSPEAAVFQPDYSPIVLDDHYSRLQFNQLGVSSATATKTKELLQKRRFSAAEIVPILQRCSIDVQPSPEHLPGQMWCNSTPQPNLQKGAGVQTSKERINSL